MRVWCMNLKPNLKNRDCSISGSFDYTPRLVLLLVNLMIRLEVTFFLQ